MAELVPSQSPLAAAVGRLESALDAIDVRAYADLSPDEARSVAARVRRVRARLDAHVGAAARAVEALVPLKGTGATSTPNLLAGDFGGDQREAARQVKLAKSLAKATLTEDALARGDVSTGHASVIADTMGSLPPQVTPPQREACEKALLQDARRLSLKDLQRRARRVGDAYLPGPHEVDRDENARLERQEAAARARTELTLWDNRDGTWSGSFTVPDLHAELLSTMLDAYASPRRRHLDPDPERDQLTTAQRRGRAFTQLLERVPTDQLPTTGGTPATLVVTIDHERLAEQTSAATLTTGSRLSAGELRRLACSAGILPMVLGGPSVPLDMGRTRRLFTTHQRYHQATRDLGCVAPGCDRPPGWCDSHHWRRAWEHGGTTDRDDGCLLCPWHHQLAHDQHWQFRLRDGTMQTRLPQGPWRTNHRWRP